MLSYLTKLHPGWTMAAAGLACGCGAAFLKGGWFGALTAAAAGLQTMAVVFGYTQPKPPEPTSSLASDFEEAKSV